MASLPRDIIADILSRLSVKDLLRFRSVSKSWRSLIDRSDFVHLHLLRSLQSHARQTLILRDSDLSATNVASLNSFSNLDYPLMSFNVAIKLLGSCDGLLCISNIVDDMAIWNPSTKKYQLLPCFPVTSPNLYVYGFGYDSINDDYKVVRIDQFGGLDGKPIELKVYVCSFRRKWWRRIYPDIDFALSFPEFNGVFAGGSLHWVVSPKDQLAKKNLVLAFDLGAESFREVPQPDYPEGRFQVGVAVLGDCFCVVANYVDVRVDAWVMKEYGVKESWTRLFSIAKEEGLGSLSFVKPLAYSSGCNQVLLEHDNIDIFWYDLNRRKRNKDVRVPGMPISFETVICLESLISLNFKQRRGMQRSGKDEKNVKKRDDFLSEGFKLVL